MVPFAGKGNPAAAAGGVVPACCGPGLGVPEEDPVDHGTRVLPRASSASQSISFSRSRAARQASSRPQMTPRSPSPMPVKPPYLVRQRQMLHCPVCVSYFLLSAAKKKKTRHEHFKREARHTLYNRGRHCECYDHKADTARRPLRRTGRLQAVRHPS